MHGFNRPYCANFKIYIRIDQNTHKIILHYVHKHYLVSNKILIKLLLFQSHDHFIFLAPLLCEKCKRLFSYRSTRTSVSYTHICLIWVPRAIPRTGQLLLINISFWYLILKGRKFLLIPFWVSFKLMEWGFATFFTVHRHAIATTNPWFDQCAVCSTIKEDTFTLVTLTFERLCWFWKTKISMKAD